MRTCYCFAYLFNVLKLFIYLFHVLIILMSCLTIKCHLNLLFPPFIWKAFINKKIRNWYQAMLKPDAKFPQYFYIDWRFVRRNRFTVVSAFCCLYFISTYQTFINLISNFIFTKTFFTVKLCLSKKPLALLKYLSTYIM